MSFSIAIPLNWFGKVQKDEPLPSVLNPSRNQAAVRTDLEIRERTMVLLAASTGLRQSELFALRWGDIDFSQGTMNVTHSIAYGIVGPMQDGSIPEARARTPDSCESAHSVARPLSLS